MSGMDRRSILGFAIGLLGVMLVVWLRYLSAPLVGDRATVMPFMLPIIAAAAVGGWWPGIATTVLSALCTTHFFMAPAFTFGPLRTSDGLLLANFVFVGGVVSAAFSALHAARRRADREHAHAESELAARLEVDRHRLSDAAEREATEKALRLSEERFRTAHEISPHGFAILCPSRDAGGAVIDLVIEYINEAGARMIERDAHGLLGRRVSEVLPGQDSHDGLFALWSHVLESGETTEREVRFADHGVERWFRTTAVRLGERLAIAYADMSERKNLEFELERRVSELAEADRRKDEFLATLAHELRNPLAAIRNSVFVLRGSDAPRSGALDILERQSGHLANMVNELLELSRIATGRVVLHKAPVVLQTALQSAIESASVEVQKRNHRLHVSMPDLPFVVDGDATRLGQIFANLVINAAKFTGPGGDIWLRMRRVADEVEVVVEDNGEGIAQDMMPFIFDAFTKGDSVSEGLGLGLNVVRRLVQKHGGTIEAYSEGRERGASFVVRLPLHEQGRAALRSSEADETVPLGAGVECRLLVIDDNHDAADSLAVLAHLYGAQTRTIYRGEDALATAESFQPHIVLLDLGMPGMSGFDVARALRARFGAAIQIVAVSGWGRETDRADSAQAGFDEHLLKPVEPEQLSRTVREAMARLAEEDARKARGAA